MGEQDYFFSLTGRLAAELQGAELFTAWCAGETSDFVRLNHGLVRQAGNVRQCSLGLDLIDGKRHSAGSFTLSGSADEDFQRCRRLLASLRETLGTVPEDPHLHYATEVHSSSNEPASRLPPSTVMVERLSEAARSGGYDLVGILASGNTYSGFANSLGQTNWHSSHSFNVDWSLHLQADKAVKVRYAGVDWDDAEIDRRMTQAAAELSLLGREPVTLKPGRYRTYLAPMALEDVLDMLSWGGFGLRSQKLGESPLTRLVDGRARLHPEVSLSENNSIGIAADFDSSGFKRPEKIDLIKHGRHGDSLVSPRSAAEFGVPCNGASAEEAPLALNFAAGQLQQSEVLHQLGDGVYLGNAWYLNYSDRNAARITGMTRFASFWVEAGEIRAPLNAMRFDDSVYHLLGEGLLGITQDRELLLDPGSYGGRSTRASLVPGVLVDGMTFTL